MADHTVWQPLPRKPSVPTSTYSEQKGKVSAVDHRMDEEGIRFSISSLSSSPHCDGTPRSNLDSFLDHTTASVQCQYPTQDLIAEMGLCERNCEESATQCKMILPYFSMGDLWRFFDEWSAYGTEVPLTLPTGESVVQYYVPYLSALQIYLHPSTSDFLLKRRQQSDESDCSDVSSEASGEFSSSDTDNLETFVLHKKVEDSSKNSWCSCAWDSASSFSSSSSQKSSSLEDTDTHAATEGFGQGSGKGYLAFEYFDSTSPYSRAPLARKVDELAKAFPHLHSLRSNELSSASWFSVAWYPIYRIPMGPTMQDLSACFLTFHSLWTPPLVKEGAGAECAQRMYQRQGLEAQAATKGTKGLELRAFGLMCHKLRGPCWEANSRRAASLASSADSWLRQLQVQHPDFDFFASRESR